MFRYDLGRAGDVVTTDVMWIMWRADHAPSGLFTFLQKCLHLSPEICRQRFESLVLSLSNSGLFDGLLRFCTQSLAFLTNTYTHTVILSYTNTVIHIYVHTPILSYTHTCTLIHLYCHTYRYMYMYNVRVPILPLSIYPFSHTPILSYTHTFILPYHPPQQCYRVAW